MSVYHEGELAVQERAGVRMMAERVGRIISPTIPHNMWDFLNGQPWLIIGSVDDQQQLWASTMTGGQGFVNVVDQSTLMLNGEVVEADPLWANLQINSQLGLLFIDLERRTRVRVNGSATLQKDKIELRTQQVYSNCSKYIQSRFVQISQQPSKRDIMSRQTQTLSSKQVEWIQRSDTFFIASAYPDAGVDVSHRGGMPGFVRIVSENQLEFPDYSGNMMFNTLGNIAANPKAGLLFIDFGTGSTLQLTGEAYIIWDETRIKSFPGTERVVTFRVGSVIEAHHALLLNSEFRSYSDFNPPEVR